MASDEESSARCCWSYGRIRFTVLLALLQPLLTLAVCYAMWCLQGCNPLLPCISDLGLVWPMRQTFNVGLTTGAVLLTIALLDIFQVRIRLFRAMSVGPGWHCFNVVLLVAGLAIFLGVGAIGFFPWNENLDWHMTCANTIFYGGTAWGLGNSCVLRRYQQDLPEESSWQTTLTRARTVQLALLLVSFSSLTAMETVDGVTGAFDQPGYLDFPNFCKASRMNGVGFHALAEWVLIFSLVAGVSTVLVDLDLCFNSALGRSESLVSKGPLE
mmetsp:Transcript_43872/g.80167  ORF Transcript_43872/g.80167 Transcript_43872/m.80167 type:complete len:270 (+) Transcript_43872:51-860(+)